MSELLDKFVKGQRIINESNPQMGLGCVEEVIEDRLLKVYFPAKSEECLYSIKTAPLRRIILRPGQMAVARDGRHFRIERLSQQNGLVIYWHGDQFMSEDDLEDKVPLSSSLGRMYYGNVGYPEDLPLRLAAHKLRSKMLSSGAYFMGASRASLLPHQLYVTERVCSMINPRVLLSDEVGLGKTIEAGRIFSVLRECGRASRVLIVLPDSLTHQWLAEMARRFNEVFSLVDSEALEEDDPYMSARRAITPWTALKDGLINEALKYDWDLLIVDEAHHLHEGQTAYEAVRQLADKSSSVLLLTATPSKSGLETEFGLLRLVDPKRFTDFSNYCEERAAWKRGSDLAKKLCASLQENDSLQRQSLTLEALKSISAAFPNDMQVQHLADSLKDNLDSDNNLKDCSHALLSALIDRHGPGRVLFRNRRNRLSTLFSGRSIHPVPLSRNVAENVFVGLKELTAAQMRQDQRVIWIASYIKSHPGEKIVLIAKRMQLVSALHERLRDNFGIYSAVFHEGLTVFERDKQAVWFTDPEGANILLCSEIGSEGRNFQAAHTLIFWDIPLSPDTVEQRIGRLDRIGQTHTVDVYIMYFRGTPEERLFAWHKILGSFAGPVEGGEEIAVAVKLDKVLLEAGDFRGVLSQSLELAKKFRQKAEDNVDYLVDLNSFNEERGRQLASLIEAETKQFDIENVVIKLLERFGINVEELSTSGLYHLTPGKNMQIESLSRLREGGMLATFDRQLALAREEIEYLNGAHPLVKEILSFALDGTEGSASAVYWKSAPKAGVIIQFLFIFEAVGQDNLELGRYLSPVPILINVTLNGNIYKGEIPSHESLKRIKPNSVIKLWEKCGERVELLTEKVVQAVQNMVKPMRDKAMEKAKFKLEGEKLRLQELSKVNPSVSQSDIEAQDDLNETVYSAIADSSPRLDAVRLVVMEPGESGRN
ncbi:MAG: RNA polymerase-associated protein RapA [Candidatus Bruticola sp.]